MFGYLSCNKEELKIKDYRIYQQFYCGLCHTLSHKYGMKGQVFLTYDMTFWLILMNGLYEFSSILKPHRCMMNPFSKKTGCYIPMNEYAADMTIVLCYLKSLDDQQDKRQLQGKVIQKLYKKEYLQIQTKYPKKCFEIDLIMKKIHELEQVKCKDLDILSKLSGNLLQQIFVYTEDEWSDILMEFFDYLGRFIYLIDAYDDLEIDKKKNVFNPLIPFEKKLDFDDWMKQTLESILALAMQSFDQLPILKHLDILRNILYSGVWNAYTKKRKRNVE